MNRDPILLRVWGKARVRVAGSDELRSDFARGPSHLDSNFHL